MKPRVLLTTRNYRIVATDYAYWLERRNGVDRMGVRRWVDVPSEDRGSYGILYEIGEALEKRRRRTKRRKP